MKGGIGMHLVLAALLPLTTDTNFMSLAGFLRWLTFIHTGHWPPPL